LPLYNLLELPNIFKSSQIIYKKRLLIFTVCAVMFSGGAALAERPKYSGVVKFTAPSITGLHSGKELPGPTTPVPDLDENMNQCAGTVQHYRLPATGYTPPPPSNDSRAGKLLYVKRNCGSCHQTENKGGTLGPPLDGIGGARGEQFITAHILDPEKQMIEFPELFGGRSNIMPHLGIRLNEAKLITAYLLTLPEPQNGFLVNAHPKIGAPSKEHSAVKVVAKPATANDASSISKGRALFLSRGCAACHTVDGGPSRFGPRLDGISTRRTRPELEEALRSGYDEPEMIRTLHLSSAEMQNIIDFLNSLPSAKPEKASSHKPSLHKTRSHIAGSNSAGAVRKKQK